MAKSGSTLSVVLGGRPLEPNGFHTRRTHLADTDNRSQVTTINGQMLKKLQQTGPAS
jgi:hypothetical protein